MKLTKQQLKQIIKEELAESLGMDQEYDRSQLPAKVRDLLDEYTGEDLEAAMDAVNAVRAMLSAEMQEYDDAELSGRDKVYDDEERESRRAGPSGPMSPEEHEQYMKLYDLDEAVRSIPRKIGLSPNRALNMGVSCAARYLEDAGYRVDKPSLYRALTDAISKESVAAESKEIEEGCGCPESDPDEEYEDYFTLA